MKNNGEQRRKPTKISLISTPVSKPRIGSSSIINKSFKCKSLSSQTKNPPPLFSAKVSNSQVNCTEEDYRDLSRAETIRIVPELLNNKVLKQSPQFSEISVQSSIQSKFTSHSYIKFTIKPIRSTKSITSMKENALLNLFSFFTSSEQIKILKIDCILSNCINTIIHENSNRLLNSFFNLYQGTFDYSSCYLKEGFNSLILIVKAELNHSIYARKDPLIVSFRYFYENREKIHSNKFWLSISHEGITNNRNKNSVIVISNLKDSECETPTITGISKSKVSSSFYKRLNQVFCHGLSEIRKGSEVQLNFAFKVIHKDYGMCKFHRIEIENILDSFSNSSLDEEKMILGIQNLCWKEPRLIKNGRFQSLYTYFSKFFIIKSVSYEFSKYYIFKIVLEFSEEYLINFLKTYTKDVKDVIKTEHILKETGSILTCFPYSNRNSEEETHRLMLLTRMSILNDKQFVYKERELTILKSKYVNTDMKYKLFNNSMFSTDKDVYSISVEATPTMKDVDSDSNVLDSETFLYLNDGQRLTFYIRELNI